MNAKKEAGICLALCVTAMLRNSAVPERLTSAAMKDIALKTLYLWNIINLRF
jgi:hypothetical protein